MSFSEHMASPAARQVLRRAARVAVLGASPQTRGKLGASPQTQGKLGASPQTPGIFVAIKKGLGFVTAGQGL